jgi:molecular chaperone HscB
VESDACEQYVSVPHQRLNTRLAAIIPGREKESWLIPCKVKGQVRAALITSLAQALFGTRSLTTMFRSSVRRLALNHRLSLSHRHSLSSPKISIQRLYSTPTTARCPSCSRPLPTPLPACPNCAYISAVPSSTPYHQIFGLTYDPNPFNVDVSLLKRRFRQAQAICHPDAWASQGPVSFAHSFLRFILIGIKGKQDLAQTLSSRINLAYQALLSPLSRAEYILELNGFEISETDHLDDVEFISEIMDAREELDGGDAETVAVVESANDGEYLGFIRDTDN